MTEKKLSTLVINQVESLDVYNKLKAQGKINTDELYMISGEADQVSGVKGDKETTYRTGNINLTPEDIGALPDTTEIPTKISELENDSGYAKSADLKTVAKTGSYNDLNDKPTIPTVPITEIAANTTARHNHDNKDVLDNITGIVDMDHMTNPVNQSDLVPYEVFQAASQMILDEIPTVPTKVSAFENDKGYLTSHQSLTDYAKKTEVSNTYATKTELTNATAGITGAMHFIGTSTTAITDHGTQNPTINGTVVSTKTAGDTVIYNHLEFVWNGARWEQLGDEGSYVLKTQKVNGKALSGDVDLTADDVGALPITGGKLTGDLEIVRGCVLKLTDVSIRGTSSGNTIYLDITNDMDRDTIITGVANPDRADAIANKEYVDDQIAANKSSTTIITWSDNGT